MFADLTITGVGELTRILHSPTDAAVYRKNRGRWAVALKREGKTLYTDEAGEHISDPYHVTVLPRGSDYSWRGVEAGECLLIEFDSDKCHNALYSFSVCDTSQIERLMLGIERRGLAAGDGRLENLRDLYAILCILASAVKPSYVPTDRQLTVQPAVDYIVNRYYERNITNDLLARKCGVSTVYFRKLFTRVYGKPPITYLRDYRMEKAKALLCSDYVSVLTIAVSVGYESVFAFSRAFRAYTGLPPSEYAKDG